MGKLLSISLLALSYDVLPELREQRNRYYHFWYFIGAVAVLGWLTVLVLFRKRQLRQPVLGVLVVVAIALGGGLGWAAWSGLADYTWGEVGIGSRWLSELSACVLGCVAWLLVAGWVLLCRR
jgi:hypothetical protein